jgi:hypothetical protein
MHPSEKLVLAVAATGKTSSLLVRFLCFFPAMLFPLADASGPFHWRWALSGPVGVHVSLLPWNGMADCFTELDVHTLY